MSPHLIRSIVALLASVGTAAAAAPALADTTGASAPAQISWSACEGEVAPGQQCSTITVPLDHARPDAGTVRLQAARIPAGDPDQRIGSLFINPGGPGAPAVAQIPGIASLLPQEVRDRFDLVTFDPRGTGSSTRVDCSPAEGEPEQSPPGSPVPSTRSEIKQQLSYDAWFRRSCAQHGGALLNRVSTADTARDMDLIRSGLGERTISYLGMSYGSFLGQTYAALFPNRLRATVMDGVVDARALTRDDKHLTAPMRQGQDVGMSETIRSSMGVCDQAGPERCALAPNALRTYDQTRRLLDKRPLQLPGLQMTRGYLDMVVGFSSYSTQMYPQMASWVKAVNRLLTEDLDPATRGSLEQEVLGLLTGVGLFRPGANYDDWAASLGVDGRAVSCLDQPAPRIPQLVAAKAAKRDRTYPGGGPWSWSGTACVGWPGSPVSAYRGPWTGMKMLNPPLMLTTTHDPALPSAGAQRTRQLLPGAGIVNVDSWGHGVLGTSQCATRQVGDYLLRPGPRGDVSCKPDEQMLLYGVG